MSPPRGRDDSQHSLDRRGAVKSRLAKTGTAAAAPTALTLKPQRFVPRGRAERNRYRALQATYRGMLVLMKPYAAWLREAPRAAPGSGGST
jgi:hypothetical protein